MDSEGNRLYFSLSWQVTQAAPDTWIGVCREAGLLAEGNSPEDLAVRVDRLVQFMVDTFDSLFSDQDLKDYFGRHGIEYNYGEPPREGSWLELKSLHAAVAA